MSVLSRSKKTAGRFMVGDYSGRVRKVKARGRPAHPDRGGRGARGWSSAIPHRPGVDRSEFAPYVKRMRAIGIKPQHFFLYAARVDPYDRQADTGRPAPPPPTH